MYDTLLSLEFVVPVLAANLSVHHFSGTLAVYCCCHVIVAPSPVVKCVLVASPGFVKDQFISYLYKEAVRQDNKILLENRPKFMLVHSSSGHKYSLKGTKWWLGGVKPSNLITKSQLIEMRIVLQKSFLIPL